MGRIQHLALGLVIIGASNSVIGAQTETPAETILRWLARAEVRAHATRPLLLSVASDAAPADPDALALANRLRSRGLPVVPMTARPTGDTVWVRFTRPVRDSAASYRVGVERVACARGRLVGGRSVITIRCAAGQCRYVDESPLGDGGVDAGSCRLRWQ